MVVLLMALTRARQQEVGARPSAARPRSGAKGAAATDRPRRPCCSLCELGNDQPIEGTRRWTRQRASPQTMRTESEWQLQTERETVNPDGLFHTTESPAESCADFESENRIDPELHTREDAVNETADMNNRGFCAAPERAIEAFSSVLRTSRTRELHNRDGFLRTHPVPSDSTLTSVLKKSELRADLVRASEAPNRDGFPFTHQTHPAVPALKSVLHVRAPRNCVTPVISARASEAHSPPPLKEREVSVIRGPKKSSCNPHGAIWGGNRDE